MKAKRFILNVMAVLFASSPMYAQSHIDKVVDEIEKKGVDVSKVVKRDPKTKKPYSIVKSLTFYSKDSNYANRLKEAFKKDAENAIEEKVEKKGNSYILIFIDGKKKTTYTLNIQERQEKDPRVDLSIVMRDGNVKEIDKYNDLLNMIGTKGIQVKGLEDFEFFDWNNINRNQKNIVLIRGGVRIPGSYELGKTVTTVRSLIEQSGGFTSDATIANCAIYRMKDDNTLERLAIDMAGIMAGTVADMPLKNKDVLVIPTQMKRETTNLETIQKKQDKQP